MDQFPPLYTKVSPSRQFFILLGLTCLGLLLASFITIIVIKLIPGASIEAIVGGDPSLIGLAQWMQVISTLCIFCIPVVLFKIIVHPREDYLKFKSKSPRVIWLLTLAIALAVIPTADLFTRIMEKIPISTSLRMHFEQMEDKYNNQMLLMLQFDSFFYYLKSLILIALLPAIFEELLFRGCLQQIMVKWINKPFIAILITSIIFSAIHGSYFGFLPRVFIGMVLGYVFFYGRNIWLNMLIHFINNGMIITVLYFQHLKTGSIEEALKSQSSISLCLISAGALVILWMLFTKAVNEHKQAKISSQEPPLSDHSNSNI